MLSSSDVERAILTQTPIRAAVFFQTIGSTNDYAKELLAGDVAPLTFPLLISAEEQTAGRGRGAKKWWTGKGAVAVSLVLNLAEIHLNRDNLPSLSPTVAEIVCETVRNTVGPEHSLEIKLPNDVYLNGKKVCGILIESPKPDYAIFGIGINTNNSVAHIPDELKAVPITTILDETGQTTDHAVFLVELFNRFFEKWGL
ncbi:MAG: biotin--[acetyl-CoA-carboxylase] ligase [Planctomycetaceae bacterium]|nr:biotin--[acetyl-CoA-carboxylase] ligase [Planctomycetaceae bacterium]